MTSPHITLVRWVYVAIAVFAAVYIALDFNALYALRTNQNTGLYLQSLVNLVHSGTTFDQPDGKPHLAVHNQWLVLALAPLVALWPRPETMIVVQVLALAASAIPLYLLVRDFGGPRGAGIALALAWLVSPSLQGWAYNGFEPEHFVPLLAFSLALAVRHRSLTWTIVCAQLLLGVKEDQAWFLAWFGALGALWYDRRLGLVVLGLALLNGGAYYGIERALGYSPERPHYGLVDREWPQQLSFLAEILVPFAFAPLTLGVRVLLALPFLVELFFTQDRTYAMYRAGYYYTEPFVALVAVGAAFAIARRPFFARYALGGAIAMALFFNTTVLHLGRHPFSPDPQYGAARAWALSARPIDFPCPDEGAWTVASANPNARLVDCGKPTNRGRPAWKDVSLASPATWTRGPQR
ncbi:MAG: DUF2079 domain-containing protein [Candidatus Baltobacteraceae bacterium]